MIEMRHISSICIQISLKAIQSLNILVRQLLFIFTLECVAYGLIIPSDYNTMQSLPPTNEEESRRVEGNKKKRSNELDRYPHRGQIP